MKPRHAMAGHWSLYQESLEVRAGSGSMNRGIRNWRAVTPALALVIALALDAPGLVRAQPQVNGQWVTVLDPSGSGDLLMPINPVHAGLFEPVRSWSSPGPETSPERPSTKRQCGSRPPGNVVVQDILWDLFCNGMSFLPDGRAFITGGSKPYPDQQFQRPAEHHDFRSGDVALPQGRRHD